MSTPTPIPVNPKTFTIIDPNLMAQSVTGLNVKFGRSPVGPFSLIAAVPAKDLTASAEAAGTITGALTDLESNLAPGDWYAVVTAVNAGGESDPTPAIHFQVVPPRPSPPTSFGLA